MEIKSGEAVHTAGNQKTHDTQLQLTGHHDNIDKINKHVLERYCKMPRCDVTVHIQGGTKLEPAWDARALRHALPYDATERTLQQDLKEYVKQGAA